MRRDRRRPARSRPTNLTRHARPRTAGRFSTSTASPSRSARVSWPSRPRPTACGRPSRRSCSTSRAVLQPPTPTSSTRRRASPLPSERRAAGRPGARRAGSSRAPTRRRRRRPACGPLPRAVHRPGGDDLDRRRGLGSGRQQRHRSEAAFSQGNVVAQRGHRDQPGSHSLRRRSRPAITTFEVCPFERPDRPPPGALHLCRGDRSSRCDLAAPDASILRSGKSSRRIRRLTYAADDTLRKTWCWVLPLGGIPGPRLRASPPAEARAHQPGGALPLGLQHLRSIFRPSRRSATPPTVRGLAQPADARRAVPPGVAATARTSSRGPTSGRHKCCRTVVRRRRAQRHRRGDRRTSSSCTTACTTGRTSSGFTEENFNAQENNFGNRRRDRTRGREATPRSATPRPAPSRRRAELPGPRQRQPDHAERRHPAASPTMYLWQPIAGRLLRALRGRRLRHVRHRPRVHAPDLQPHGRRPGLEPDRPPGRRDGRELVGPRRRSSTSTSTASCRRNDENPFAVGAYVTGNKQAGIRNYNMNTTR